MAFLGLVAMLILTACGSTNDPAPDSESTDGDCTSVDGDSTTTDGDTEAAEQPQETAADSPTDGDGSLADADSETPPDLGSDMDSDGDPDMDADADSVDGDTDTDSEADSETEIPPDTESETSSDSESDTEAFSEDPNVPPPAYHYYDLLRKFVPWGMVCNQADAGCFNGPTFDDLFSLGSTRNWAKVGREIECYDGVHSCEEAAICNAGFSPDSDSVCARLQPTGTPSSFLLCDDQTAIACSPKSDDTWFISQQDCAADGFVCQQGHCVPASNPTCGTLLNRLCLNNWAIFCADDADSTDFVRTWDCAENPGVVCGDRCRGSSDCTWEDDVRYGCMTSCDPQSPRCYGSVAYLCDTTYTDCRKLDSDFHCRLTEGALSCVPTVATCPTNDEFRCNGTHASMCMRGKWLEFDCADADATCSVTAERCVKATDR